MDLRTRPRRVALEEALGERLSTSRRLLFWGDRQAPAPRAVASGGRRLEGTASRGCASSDQRSGSGLRGVKQWLAPPGSPEDRQRERPTREENGPESSGVQESSESTHTHTHEGRMRRALTAAAAAAVTNEAPDLSSTALWTARGRVLCSCPSCMTPLCPPLWRMWTVWIDQMIK